MNLTEARKEARRRWGPLGFAKPSRYIPEHKYVGRKVLVKGDLLNLVLGFGKTWEEAFSKADHNKDR